MLHRNLRLESEYRAGASDVGDAVSDVAFAVFAHDLRINLLAQTLGQQLGNCLTEVARPVPTLIAW